MELLILGPLEVRDGDRMAPLPGGRHRAILAVLVLHAGQVVSSERLIDDVWGERPLANAARTLQVCMSRLRKALPEGVVLTEAGGYRLAVDAAAVDSWRFAKLVEQGRQALACGEPARADRLLGEALALWRGPALADVAYETFAQGEIARLEELRLVAIEERIDAGLALGRHGELVAELERLVRAQPLRERMRAQLMLALYRAGRQADALQAYQDARRELVEQLGIEPGPALRALEAAILAQDPALAAAPAAVPAQVSSPAPPAPEPEPPTPASEPPARKIVTVLFSDVVASSSLAEALDPEWLARVMGRLFDTAAAVVARHGGTVDKFIGDAVMAVFGVPRVHEDDALRALRAALDLRDALAALNEELQRDWGVRIALRTGVNTGEVMTGDPTLGRLLTGDAVVVATRLQDAAGPGEILVGERTALLSRGAFELGEPVLVAAKGRGHITARRVVRALSCERPRGVPSAPRVFVGRRTELELLMITQERVMGTGEAHLVAIVGEPGVGKTTLVNALRERVGDGVRWHVGRCVPYGSAVTYRPLAEILRGWLGVDESDSADVVLELLGDRRILGLTLGLDIGAGADPDDARRRLHEAWAQFLGELALDGPAVVVVEDLHWADQALLELLERAAREASGQLLILVTARPEVVERAPAWTTRAANATQLRLEPLSREEATEMLSRLTEPLPERTHALLLDRAEGNPFFLEEALAALIDRGSPAAAVDVPVPDSVQGLLAARLDLLPRPERQALQAAAVVGHVFWEGAVSALGDGTPFDTSLLEQRGFVRRQPRSSLAGEREFVFKHALTRDVAYGTLPLASRASLHARAGEWLEGAGAEPSLLAYHFGRALELAVEARESQTLRQYIAERSFRYRVLAAGHALRAGDPASAAAQLARGTDLSELPDPDPAMVGEAGRLLVALGRFGDSVELLSGFASSGHPAILRELGVATCKLHRDDARSAAYARGQGYLERAAAAGDADATASLAGTWKGIDERRARDLYRRAAELDPTDPYPLGSLLELEIEAAGDLSPAEAMRERIASAIERCRRQAAARENLPWAHYDLGKLQLLLALPYEGLDAYTKAVDISPAAFMVETSLGSLRRLSAVAERIPGLVWSQELLELALRARFGSQASVSGSVVVLAGGTSSEEEASGYAPMLIDALRDFTGTVISGGTAHGVSGVAGELADRCGSAVRVIGYLPHSLPADARADDRYHELRRTDGRSFTPLEPLTYWNDLVAAGIAPAQVKVIGTGGGRVAAAEYAIALALGAEVGIVRGSGRAADAILSDPHWSSSRRMTTLAADTESLRSFVARPPARR